MTAHSWESPSLSSGICKGKAHVTADGICEGKVHVTAALLLGTPHSSAALGIRVPTLNWRVTIKPWHPVQCKNMGLLFQTR